MKTLALLLLTTIVVQAVNQRRSVQEAPEETEEKQEISCDSSQIKNEDGECVCPTGAHDIGNNKCLACDQGTYFTDENQAQCLPCSEHCARCADKTGKCEACSESFIMQGKNNKCVCSSDSYLAESGECQVCATNCASCNQRGVCTKCRDTYGLLNNQCKCSTGWHSSNDYEGTCYQCPFSTYWDGNECLQCPLRNCLQCTTDSGVCSQCTNGYTLVNYECVVYEADQHEDDEEHPIKQDKALVCGSGEFFDGLHCAPCKDGCERCNDFTGVCFLTKDERQRNEFFGKVMLYGGMIALALCGCACLYNICKGSKKEKSKSHHYPMADEQNP